MQGAKHSQVITKYLGRSIKTKKYFFLQVVILVTVTKSTAADSSCLGDPHLTVRQLAS